MPSLPAIPEGFPVFGDERWIEVRESSATVREVLNWYEHDMDLSRHNKGVKDWNCELCEQPVMAGEHHTRSYGCWVHKDCMSKAWEWIRAVEAIH